MTKTKTKNAEETDSESEAGLTPEQIAQATLPPVDFMPDMRPVFAYAEKYQENIGALSLSDTKQGILELYTRTGPALELSLAVLTESVGLKASLNDVFKPETT